MIVWISIIVLVVSSAVGLIIHIHNTRRKYAHIYCPKYSSFLLAHLAEIVKAKESFAELLLRWSKESGDDLFVLFSSWRVHVHVVDTAKVKVILGSSTLLKTNSSVLATFCGKQVIGSNSLLTEPGSKHWALKRKMFDPFFHAKGLRFCYDHIVEISNDMVISIGESSNEATNLTKTMRKFVSFVIANVVLEITDKPGFFALTSKITDIFIGLAIQSRNKNTFWVPWKFRELKKSVSDDLETARTYFKNHILSQSFENLNLSSMFGQLIHSNVDDDNLNIEEAINDMLMFFFAGIDTSMHTINYSFYEMLRNKHDFEKLEQEVLCVYGSRTEIRYDEIKYLKYLDKFIKEVLRYHPIVSTSSKVAGPSGYDLCGVRIPGNTNLHVNIECVQKADRYWDDPLTFCVDRWDGDVVPFSFIPFSGGTRSCIGKGLALLEIKVFISSIIRKFTIDFENSDSSDIGTTYSLTNKLDRDLLVQFTPRIEEISAK